MTAAASEDRDLVLTRLIDAPCEKLYHAWTEPELLKQWFAPLPYITPVAELDVRPGGSSLVVMRGPDGVESARHSKVIRRGHVRAEMNMHVNGAVHHVIDYRAEIFLR